MDLTPTDEQQALRNAAREFLAAAAPPAAVAELADAGSWDRSVWPRLAQLGWLGISVPERLGGVELGLLEETIVFEEVGYALLPAPLLSTVGLVLPALLALGTTDDLVERIAAGDLAAAFAWAEPDRPGELAAAADSTLALAGERLSGSKLSVPDLDRVGGYLVAAHRDGEPALAWVDGKERGIALSPVDAIDGTGSLGTLTLDAAASRLVGSGAAAAAALETARRRAAVLAAAEAVGITARVLEESVAYAGQRSQFGRLIGTYQGVSHPLADTYVGLELSRSLMIWAALAIDADKPEAEAAVAAAAAKALPTAIAACEVAIQVHGGIGMTWESPLHRYYKRALTLSALIGPADGHRAQIAATLLPGAH